jgi:hypothetical protein
MSHYIAGGLMLLLLFLAGLFGLEVYGVYHAAHMVEAALLDAQPKLAADGGVSGTVSALVRRRVGAEGGDLSALTVSGSPARTPAGAVITLVVRYRHRYSFPVWPGWRQGVFEVERQATTVSGWAP